MSNATHINKRMRRQYFNFYIRYWSLLWFKNYELYSLIKTLLHNYQTCTCCSFSKQILPYWETPCISCFSLALTHLAVWSFIQEEGPFWNVCVCIKRLNPALLDWIYCLVIRCSERWQITAASFNVNSFMRTYLWQRIKRNINTGHRGFKNIRDKINIYLRQGYTLFSYSVQSRPQTSSFSHWQNYFNKNNDIYERNSWEIYHWLLILLYAGGQFSDANFGF